MWVGFLITCERENWESEFSILRPSWVVLSFVHHFDNLALKSPIPTVWNGFFWVTNSAVKFHLLKKCSSSLANWLGDL